MPSPVRFSKRLMSPQSRSLNSMAGPRRNHIIPVNRAATVSTAMTVTRNRLVGFARVPGSACWSASATSFGRENLWGGSAAVHRSSTVCQQAASEGKRIKMGWSESAGRKSRRSPALISIASGVRSSLPSQGGQPSVSLLNSGDFGGPRRFPHRVFRFSARQAKRSVLLARKLTFEIFAAVPLDFLLPLQIPLVLSDGSAYKSTLA
jgi:hypothetical protein